MQVINVIDVLAYIAIKCNIYIHIMNIYET